MIDDLIGLLVVLTFVDWYTDHTADNAKWQLLEAGWSVTHPDLYPPKSRWQVACGVIWQIVKVVVCLGVLAWLLIPV